MGISRWLYVDIVEIIKETENAFLIDFGDEMEWIPKSQIADAEDYAEGDKDIEIGITPFIAREKGIETK